MILPALTRTYLFILQNKIATKSMEEESPYEFPELLGN